jgi:hypothetical protein
LRISPARVFQQPPAITFIDQSMSETRFFAAIDDAASRNKRRTIHGRSRFGLEARDPVDDADRVIGLSIVGVDLDSFAIVNLCVLGFFHLQIHTCGSRSMLRTYAAFVPCSATSQNWFPMRPSPTGVRRGFPVFRPFVSSKAYPGSGSPIASASLIGGFSTYF